MTDATARQLLEKLARIERKLDLLLGHDKEIELSEILRQTHSSPQSLRDYLIKKGR